MQKFYHAVMLPKHFIISCDIGIGLPEHVSNLDSNNIISNEEAVNLLLYRLLTQTGREGICSRPQTIWNRQVHM